MNRPTVIALVYDFDGTLSPGNMQEYEFIPSVGLTSEAFWSGANETSLNNDADSVLSYMERMIASARNAKLPLTVDRLRLMGQSIELFDGVTEWFEQINDYAKERGVIVQHYVNSSGIREMIEGSTIAHHFHKIYASSFLYDNEGIAYWPAVAINYTNKTQFIFKINKGIETVHDATLVNEHLPREERPIPFRRIIFVGDGLTDIPSMRLVHSMGGHSIAVYDPQRADKRDQMLQLIADKRVNYVCEANYTPESAMQMLVRKIIDKIAIDAELANLQHDALTNSRY